jgi:SsrA-binding protein
MAKAEGEKVLSMNRQAGHNYHLEDRFEAGMVLTGTEVKSAREGRVNLRDSYANLKDNEVWLYNCHINPYTHGNIYNHDPLRTRKLLLHKEEIRRLIGKVRERGYTLVPTRMYLKNGRIKLEIALAKGKREYDKRETERRREADKEARQAVRSRKLQ